MSAGLQPMSNEGVLGVDGVPGISVDWYRGIVGFAHDMPSGVQVFAGLLSDGVLLAFGALFLVALWRARNIGTRAVVLAVAAPTAVVGAYLISELIKTFLREERPCRAVPGIPATILDCPEFGDWSLPSNHSTIGAAAAVALFFAWRRSAYFAPLLAVLEGFSRVLVGAHYPHDVLAGFALGSVVAAALMVTTDRALVARINSVVEARAATVRMPVVAPETPAQRSGTHDYRARPGGPVSADENGEFSHAEHTVRIAPVETTKPIPRAQRW